MSTATPRTEEVEPVVRQTSGGRVTQLDVTCRCGHPLTLVWHRDGYRVTKRLPVTPGSAFALGMASLTACPNRNCSLKFPELVDSDRLSDLFSR